MTRRTILGILGTLFLGALGSGLWELIKPAFSFLGSTALGVVSLGFDSVVNDIYQRVGRADPNSTWIKGSTLLIVGLLTYLLTGYWLRSSFYEGGARPSRLADLGLALALGVLAAVALVGGARHGYVAKTRGYFDYVQRVSAPYISPEERLLIDSQLAQVKTRADFERLVATLTQHAAANGIQVDSEDDY